jgi:hypothetical protein
LTDRAVKVGDREVKLGEVRGIQFNPGPRVLLQDGKEVEGPVSGLDAVPVRLGGQLLTVDLGKAVEVKFASAPEAELIWYTLVVRQGDKEVLRQCESLSITGLLRAPLADPGPSGIKAPALDGDKVERMLAAPVADVAVGGAGRYLLLHQPRLRQLAVFDVNAAEVVGHIPVNEDDAKFAAGLEDVVVVLPHAGTIERWNLKTLERDVAATLPVKGMIRSVAMASASRGPLLVHAAAGTEQLSPTSFTLVNVETMRLVVSEVKLSPHMTAHFRDLWHVRAAANGKVFGLWCTSHSPTGMGVFELTNADVKTYYAHNSFGHVLPGPDGRLLFTGSGLYAPQVQLQEQLKPGDTMIPSCHGDYWLSLPPAGKEGEVTVHARGRTKPLATFTDFELKVPKEETIKHDFTFDKRVHLIPEARLVITIPTSEDRLVLRQFGG